MSSVSSPLYDIHKTFEENFSNPPFSSIIPPSRQLSAKNNWIRFLDHSIASRIGAAPCAVTTGKGIALLARLGFDILTYKTIRRRTYPSHSLPNIVYIDKDTVLNEQDLKHPLYTRANPVPAEKIAISNSFGNGCLDTELLVNDIKFAKSALLEGQILIVSVYGEGKTLQEIAIEFAEAAWLAKQAGADVVELNLSCPNLLKKGNPLYCDTAVVRKIIASVLSRIENFPVIVKLGLLPESYSLSNILETITRAGARGVSAINSISMRVLDQAQKPAFGKRIYSGVSGFIIRPLALKFVRKIVEINIKEKLNLVILGIGGITLPVHFDEFINAGADAALVATGMMWNPYLALQYQQQQS